MKRLGAIIALTLIFAMLCPLFISADDGAPDTSAAAVSYLYCFNTDKVLYEKNTGTSRAPGSSTKMMTALIALENIDDFSKKIAITSELGKAITSSSLHTLKYGHSTQSCSLSS